MKQFISSQDAADYIGFKLRTLQVWRDTGDGPKYYKRNSRIRYKINDLDTWMEMDGTPAKGVRS